MAGRSGRVEAHTRGEARESILVAALQIFSERGFDGTTTREVAAAAGVNLGLITYYFGNKEKLWKAAVDRAFEGLRDALAGALADDSDVRDQLEAVIRICVSFAGHNPAIVRLMNEEGRRPGPRMRWHVDRHGKPLFDLATSILERARREGVVADVAPLHLYYMFIGAVGMIFSQAPECLRLSGTDPTAAEDVIATHADAVVRLFMPEG
ncbi:MAG: TetR/AcrR family transcriptional regulator [Myxococcales bacterium]|nr:MAG: TetR/AcrR family transcriptional regulator [Myxococcales bacterium]